MSWGRLALAIALLAFIGWNAFCRARPMNDGWDVLRVYRSQSNVILGLVVLVAILVMRRMRK